MDRVKAILQLQWLAYWRRFRRAGSLRTNNLGPLVLLVGFALIKYLQQLPLAATQLSKGGTTRFEALLLLVFLAWIFPVIGESRRSVSNRLLHFPLTINQLFLIRVGSLFCSPISWIIVGASLALGFPITASQHPITGLLALLSFLLFGLFIGLTFTHIANSKIGRRVAFSVLLAVSAVGGLLWPGPQTGSIASMLARGSPMRLVAVAAVSATPLRSLLVVVGMTALVGLLAVKTFAFTLQPRQDRHVNWFLSFGSTQLPGRFGGLLKKDLRYWSRLLDLYLALPIVIFFNLYLTSDTAPSAIVLSITVGVLFLPCVNLAFNSFGLDNPLGFDRYSLFPLSWKEKLLSKNMGFAVVMIGLFLSILPSMIWKLGVRASVFGLMEFIAVGLAYVSCGNWMSVRRPFKMQFYRFASGGAPIDAAIGMIFGSFPAAVTVHVLYFSCNEASWRLGVMVLVFLGIYLFSVFRSASILQTQQEAIRRALE